MMNASELRHAFFDRELWRSISQFRNFAEPAALRVKRRVNARHVFIWPDSDSVPVLAHRVHTASSPNAERRVSEPRIGAYVSSHASRFLLLRSLNAATSAGPGRGPAFAREPFRARFRGEVPVC